MKLKFRKTDKVTLFFIFCLSIVGIIMWKQCRYGFANIDESLFLAIPYRLYQGDALLSEEWHISQLSSFVVYPFLSLFMAINNSTDSIVLIFRRIYTVIQLLVSIILFFKFKKINKFGALIGSLLFAIYTPFGIRALSYNSIAILCLSLFAVFFYSDYKIELILSGFFMHFLYYVAHF